MQIPFRWVNCFADVQSNRNGDMALAYLWDVVEPSVAALERNILRLAETPDDPVNQYLNPMPHSSQHFRQYLAYLRVLTDLLGAETDRLPRTSSCAHRLCRELMTIGVLVPKLEATFQALVEQEAKSRAQGPSARAAMTEPCRTNRNEVRCCRSARAI
jgi:hypothetical protein